MGIFTGTEWAEDPVLKCRIRKWL